MNRFLKSFILLSLFFAVAGLESFALVFLLKTPNEISGWSFLLWHSFAVLLSSVPGGKLYSMLSRPWLFVLLTFFFPLFAPLAFLFIRVLVEFMRPSSILEDFHIETEKESGKDTRELGERYSNVLPTLKEVEPLVDVLQGHSSPERKQGAIEALQSMKSAYGVELIKESLNDPDGEVRFYASGALMKMEAQMNARVLELLEEMKRGGEPKTLHADLGRAYYEFIYLGLEAPSADSHYLKEAIQHFEKALNFAPSDQKVLKALHRAYMSAGEHEKAGEMEKEYSLNRRGPDPLHQAERAFERGEFLRARNLVEQANINNRQFRLVRDIYDLWHLKRV